MSPKLLSSFLNLDFNSIYFLIETFPILPRPNTKNLTTKSNLFWPTKQLFESEPTMLNAPVHMYGQVAIVTPFTPVISGLNQIAD